MAIENSNSYRWYQRWWGIGLISLGSFILLVAAIFGSFVGYYYLQIKQGKGADIDKIFYGTTASSQIPGEKSLERKELEDADRPFLGNPEAKIVIVEFIDFQCPNCLANESIMKKIEENYGYKVKIVARDFPVESNYPQTSKLSELAFCAKEQGLYWKMHDVLFDNQANLSGNLTNEKIRQLADASSADYNNLIICMQKTQTKLEINKDYALGNKYKVMGTPTFFVNGIKVEGLVKWEEWDKFLKGI